jgi:protein SCO1/2
MIRRLLCLALLAALPALAQEGNGAAHYFQNLRLIDQDGHSIDLYNDLMKGKVVVINSFFAECHGSCPAMAKTMQSVQERLGDRLGRDVFLISITVDPHNDTPAVLRKYSAEWKARPGWSFLTGSPEQVAAALKKLGQYVEQRESHNNIILVGNDRTGLWKKVFGLAKADDVYASVESIVNDKGGSN